MQVVSQQGDSLDLICWRFYGNTHAIEAVLEKNPHVAFLAPILPTGTLVVMPDIATSATTTDTLQLWD
jgi:phage tail protein X